jgi:hypothetical protein
MSNELNVRALLALPLICALIGTGCSDGDGAITPAPDASALTDTDAGPISCEAEAATAAATAGCNGGFQGTPEENGPGGRCTPGSDTMPAGTCTAERSICMGDLFGSGSGWCVLTCPAPVSLIDAQTCPAGYRCFRDGEGEDAFGLCFRDCDADHPCQDGWTCNASLGRCEELPPS